MNCNRCGQPLPKNAKTCPACGQPAGPVYQQSYVLRQQGYTQEEEGFLTHLSELPRMFLRSFTQPGEVLRAMVERRDHVSFPVVTFLVLVLAFLGGMVLMRGFLFVLLQGISRVTGMSLAGSAASLSQGVSYIAGRVGPMAGGIAVLCQLITMLALGAVFLVYVCVVGRTAFSYELASGFLTVVSLGNVAVSLLAMALSMLSPWLSVIVMACGLMIGITQACGMLGLITGQPEGQLFTARLVLSACAVLAVLIINGVVGGLLMGGVLERVLSLLSHTGALV